VSDPLVIARTPLRLSLGGGGTDLPFYSGRFGGDVLSMAISLHVTVIARGGRLDAHHRYAYERVSAADSAAGLDEPYVREALALTGFSAPCEIASMGPVPSGTGLGSSGAFAVSLLSALHGLAGRAPSRLELVEQACELELDRLRRPVGKHDQYICGLGGLRRLVIDPSGSVRVDDPAVPKSTMDALAARFVLLYTGVRRDSATSLAPPSSTAGVEERIEQLHRIRKIGDQMRAALETGDLDWVAELMREHWAIKRGDAAPSRWDEIYDIAVAHGARAGKLVGAGGGGFLLLFVDPGHREGVLAAAAGHGVREVPFDYCPTGTTVTRIDHTDSPELLP
jgi:D-glycero-alpha-D-manno-heptose-7-phosphate kinase